MRSTKSISAFITNLFTAASTVDEPIVNTIGVLSDLSKAARTYSQDLVAKAENDTAINRTSRAIDLAEAQHALRQRLTKLESTDALDPDLLARARAAVAAAKAEESAKE